MLTISQRDYLSETLACISLGTLILWMTLKFKLANTLTLKSKSLTQTPQCTLAILRYSIDRIHLETPFLWAKMIHFKSYMRIKRQEDLTTKSLEIKMLFLFINPWIKRGINKVRQYSISKGKSLARRVQPY